MDSHRIVKFVYIIMISGQAYSHIVKPTCSCNVTGQKDSCFAEEHSDTQSNISFPTRVVDLDANVVKPSEDKVFLDLMWEGPSGGSLNHVSGFVIELKFVNRSSQTLLIRVGLTPERGTNNKVTWNMRCEFESSAYERNNDLLATVYPTPTPPPNKRRQSQTISIYINRKMAEGNAVDWEPSLIFKRRDANKFNIKINVPKALQTSVPALRINFEPQLRDVPKTTRNNEGIFNFTSIYLGKKDALTCFKIMVTKVCAGCQGGETHCKDYTGNCTIPNPITITGKLWTGSNCARRFPAVLVTSTVTPDQVTTEQTRENYSMSVIVPVVVIITLVLAAFLIITAYRKKPTWKILKGSILPCHGSRESVIYIEDIPGPPNNMKSVLLIYSDDNGPHKKVIQAFATFLQAKCMCEVFFDEWHMLEMSQDILSWHLDKLNSVDKVIMIHSKGGWLKASGKASLEAFSTVNRLPKGDTFIMMLPLIRNLMAQAKDDRFIMMYFSYTNPEFVIKDLSFRNKFEIPKHLENLVLDIHDSQMYSYNTIKSLENIKVENYHLAMEGTYLKLAIETMEDYMKQSSDWVEVQDKNSNISLHSSTDNSNTCSDEDNDRPNLIAPNSDIESIGDENIFYAPEGNSHANSDIDSDTDKPLSLISEVSLIPPEWNTDSDSSLEDHNHDRLSDFGNNHGNRCSI